MIRIAQPEIPDPIVFGQLLEGIWKRGQLSNNGPLVSELEQKLSNYFNIEHVILVSSGTIALQLAINACNLKQEVITTPFSYIATTSSLVWEKCIPVFADIHPTELTIDPEQIERLVTPQTSGILATHIFGVPCDILSIQTIAQKRNLPVIYDAAHAFGTEFRNQSLLQAGSVAALSLHATKLFHTAEGGAVITSDQHIADRVRQMRNFGQRTIETYNIPGINAKLSELHAAIGLSLLPGIDSRIADRKIMANFYVNQLKAISGISFQTLPDGVTRYNHAYFPIILEDVELAERLLLKAPDFGVEVRRYCAPSLNTLAYLEEKQQCPIAESLALRTVCIPIYSGLTPVQQNEVIYMCKEVLC